MCDTANLIDLNQEDDEQTSNTQKTELTKCPSTNATYTDQNSNNMHSICLINAPIEGRVSLDNNPFDSIQKLANRYDDPFEIVEKEACLKARQSVLPKFDVKLGNLLSLSDENLLDIDDNEHMNNVQTPVNTDDFKYCNVSTVNCAASSVYNTAKYCEMDTDSPLVRLGKESVDSVDSWKSINSSDSGGEGSAGSKNKKLPEFRKKLLKLSLSNSAFNSPVSRHAACINQRSDEESKFSPISAMFAEAAQLGEHMLAAESPLKLVDDDLMAEEPPCLFDLERDFEADLEMLNIPMLQKLRSSPAKDVVEENYLNEQKPVLMDVQAPAENTVNDGLTALEALRAKLRTKQLESKNNQDVSQLIHSLKSLICGNNVVDADKKHQAQNLLETLSKALSTDKQKNDTENTTDTLSILAPPEPIVRQSTFDIDLQNNTQRLEIPVETNNPESAMVLSTHSTISNPGTDEMPDCMVRSSATYDGETADEKREYVLPEVDPISPTQFHYSSSQTEHDVNDIVEQLTKLLQQQQIAQHAQGNQTDGSVSNPTFIVVMNSSTVGQLPNMNKRNSYTASILEHSLSDGSPDLKNMGNMRRRSQSLSTHDKVKIVKFPLNTVELSNDDDSPPIINNIASADATEFKTPSRFMPRRNSFSSGTPHTSKLSLSVRKSADTAARPTPQQRRATIMETQEEKQRQHQAVLRPLPPMPNKRKVGQHTESIMKSTVPLKATIPVKKLSTTTKTSTPAISITNTQLETGAANKNTLNSSMNFLTKTSRLSLTSTPMPLLRSSSTVGNVATSFPNACSTPSVQMTPMNRNTPSLYPSAPSTMTKPRYSYSTTPHMKAMAAPSAAAAGLKRRTLTELKAKSPIKSRASMVASGTGVSNSSRTSNSRFTTKTVQSKFSSSSRSSQRLTSSRLSTSSAIFKNKENNKP